MSEQDARIQEIARKRVVYRIPDMDAALVLRDVVYRTTDDGPLVMDLYFPTERKTGQRYPVVVVATGYPDPQGRYRRMGFTISWAQLLAASGMAVAIYATRDPAADVQAIVQYIRREATDLNIDEKRVGLLALSANVGVALSALMQDHTLTCAALLYGYTMDLEGHTGVAEAAAAFGFVNACAGKSVDDLPREVPLLMVRAGREQFGGLNDALDRFVLNALARNLPLTVVNHATAPHAFDLEDDTEMSHEIIRRVLGFLQFHLRGGSPASCAKG